MRKKIVAAFILFFLAIVPAYAGVSYLISEASLDDQVSKSVVDSKLKKSAEYGVLSDLMNAAANGDINRSLAILKTGGNVNERTKWGETALMFASKYGHQPVVELLLNNHAELNMRTLEGGNSALIFACSFAGPNIVRLLLDNGSDPNILPNTEDPLGNQPALETAVQSGNIENIKLLLEHGAHIRNSLATAIEINRLDIVKLLVEHGATVRQNIPMLVYTKGRASPEIKSFLQLDLYQELGKEDSIYPVSLDELSRTDRVVRKLYMYPKLSLEDLPQRADMETNFTYLETKILKNTIYARYGYTFDTVWLRIFFNKNFDSYRPQTTNISLTALDKKNLAYIKYLEKVSEDRR